MGWDTFSAEVANPLLLLTGLEQHGREYALIEIVNIYFQSRENAVRPFHCASTSELVGLIGLIGENNTGGNMHPCHPPGSAVPLSYETSLLVCLPYHELVPGEELRKSVS